MDIIDLTQFIHSMQDTTMNYPTRELMDIVESLKHAKRRSKKCSLLIGAGCSSTANIPLASGFVQTIKKDFPCAYERATEKKYPQCMAQLSRGEQRDLIAKHVDNAQINWAHICIALLIKHGFVDRILTTNFDPLIVKACALLGEFPAVYDFAASQLYESNKIPDKAVIYLHGQRTGFVLMNTPKECKKHSKYLAPVFTDAGTGRVWLVVGYSGESDPVFKHIANINAFEYPLYWIGYDNNEPAPHLRDELLSADKDAYYVKGYDADKFFMELCRGLNIFPPKFVNKPFSHLQEILRPIAPYYDTRTDKKNILEATYDLIDKAIASIEKPVKPKAAGKKFTKTELDKIEMKITPLIMAGKYEEALKQVNLFGDPLPTDLTPLYGSIYNNWGNDLADQANHKDGIEADVLYKEACKKYAKAIMIRPNDFNAFYNWGTTIAQQAMLKQDMEAFSLYEQACTKFAKATEIKPDYFIAFYNWGTAIVQQAKLKQDVEAFSLYEQACTKFAKATEIRPDFYEAFYNWGTSISQQARLKHDTEAFSLYEKSCTKFAKSTEIKPDLYQAFHNWGNALFQQANLVSAEKADELFEKSFCKYAKSIEINPYNHTTFFDWGNALFEQASHKQGTEADLLCNQACSKYAKAIKIEHNYSKAYFHWGNVLSIQALTKHPKEACALFDEAYEKYSKVIELQPNNYEAYTNLGQTLLFQAIIISAPQKNLKREVAEKYFLQAEDIKPGSASYNLASLWALRDNEEETKKWLDKAAKYNRLPPNAYMSSNDFDAMRDKQWFKDFLEKIPRSSKDKG